MKCLAFLLLIVGIVATSCSSKRYTDALSPDEALGSFLLDSRFEISLYVAEPHVEDPVEMVFDEEGNAFVVEMPDYPFKPESGIGGGKIKMLVDSNSDWKIDKAVVYADSLLEATSILPWQGGLIVAAAPDIFFLKDTNGDFISDTKEVLFSGFFKDNAETQITNLRYGVDNWIYAANFGQNGNIRSARNPGAPSLDVRGGDFRFRLDRGLFEAETGPTQFGHTVDDWGHRFITENSIHIQQTVIPWRYLHRHQYLPTYKAATNISSHDELMYQVTEPPYWRLERTKRRNQAYRENNLDRVEYADDHFTGACGTTIYSANTFPKGFYGNVFVADVAGNLVHRDVLAQERDSVVLIARRDDIKKDEEFLSSTDPWFRPVNFSVAPDGSLFVIDMYRQHIEGPAFIPEDLKTDMDFSNGKKMGRIYRITPKAGIPVNLAAPNMKSATTASLVQFLSHDDQWWRLQAQRLLIDHQDTSVVPALKNMIGNEADARARLHALYALEGLHSLDASIVEQAMNDDHPGVREVAIILSERYPECFTQLLKNTSDTSARVVLQATLSLGQFSNPPVIPALAKVLEKHAGNRWMRLSVLSSAAGSSMHLFDLLASSGFFDDLSKPGRNELLTDFSYIVGARNKKGEIMHLLQSLKTPQQPVALRGIAKGIDKFKPNLKGDTSLHMALQQINKNIVSPEIKEIINNIDKMVE